MGDACTARLRKEYRAILKEPVPNVWASPQEDNILVWHYVLKGLDGSAYEGGYYYGKLKFPSQYPFKPPSIMICTPNGRFATNTRLCLTMSDFHPESWNPLWSVSTILTGLHNFMHEDSTTVGSIQTSISNKRNYASETMVFNLKNKHFVNLFGDLIQQINREKEEKIRREQELNFTARSSTARVEASTQNKHDNEYKQKENQNNLRNANTDKERERYGLGYAFLGLAVSIAVIALVIKTSSI